MAVTEVAFQIVTCLCRIVTDDEALAARVALHANGAQHGLAAESEFSLTVLREGAAYRFPDGSLQHAMDVAHEVIDNRVQAALTRQLSGWTQLHGVCLEQAGGRTLLVCSPASLMRDLALALLLAGGRVSSSIGICLRRGVMVPFALPHNLRARSVERHPELAALAARLPCRFDAMGQAVFTLTPEQFGQIWRIDPAPVARIIHVLPNSGGQTRFRYGEVRGLAEILAAASHVTPASPLSQRVAMAAELNRLIKGATAHTLVMGDEREAAELILRGEEFSPAREGSPDQAWPSTGGPSPAP